MDTLVQVSVDSLLDTSIEDLITALETADSALAEIDGIKDVPGEFRDLSDAYVNIKDGVLYIIQNAPKPNSPDTVVWWVETFDKLSLPILSFLTFLLTAFFKIIKKSPAVIKTWFGKAMSFVRTRAFVMILGVVLMFVSLAVFNEGNWSFAKAVSYLLSSVFGGVGIHQVINWVSTWIENLRNKDAVQA